MSARRRPPGQVSLTIGLALLGLVAGAALLSLAWTPGDWSGVAVDQRLQTPNAAHGLGTDHYGRDVLSMLMVGARTTLGAALAAVALGVAVGAPIGLLASARGGWLDDLIMRAGDVVFAFPALILAILLTATLGPGALAVILAIGIFNVPVFARVTRGAALSLWSRDFVLAARIAGKGTAAISWQHILPNLVGLLVVQASIQASVAVIAEAGLSYVGLGAQPPAPSWGRMLNEAQTLMGVAPLQALFPGLAILITVLGLNLVGDGLRDRLDPRLQGDRR
ncbi:ABC transporter permease [Caulobacter mirabilis]|uniref:Peptide ABC transporter permease n=1 Tax=Caulobacter mirabilis TaxID=69666 RepID=A0A2D2AZA5_9CAUL|nr:ABC transporter permease [Caulobacter mirabilis]ATQ43325.1 peptide ABC transporter permease [Caulobacter mirabilis]